jgi:hypothetical protein
VFEKISEGVREKESSRGIVPCRCRENRPRRSVNRIEPWEQEELFKRKRIDDLNFWKKEISKHKYNPSAIAHRHSGVGECKSCMHVEIVSCDPPI